MAGSSPTLATRPRHPPPLFSTSISAPRRAGTGTSRPARPLPPSSCPPDPAAAHFLCRPGCPQALEREGVDTLFAYPGGASMEIHQALTRSDTIRNILCRHEQVGTRGLLMASGRAGGQVASGWWLGGRARPASLACLPVPPCPPRPTAAPPPPNPTPPTPTQTPPHTGRDLCG